MKALFRIRRVLLLATWVLLAAALTLPLVSSHLNTHAQAPKSGMWRPTGSMITARQAFTATLLHNGTVLVAGGVNSPNGSQASAELYNPRSGTWRPTGAMATARYLHTATLLHDGTVLVVGGLSRGSVLASAELYDPRSGTWRATGSMTTDRAAHTATLLRNGTVLVTGGVNNNIDTLASAELFSR